MTTFTVLGIALLAYLFVSQYLSFIRMVCGTTNRLASGRLCERADFPQGILQAFDDAASELSTVGFEFSHLERREDTLNEVDAPWWVMVLKHPNARSFVELTIPFDPDNTHPVELYFVTFCRSVDVLSCHKAVPLLRHKQKSIRINQFNEEDAIGQWQSHVAFIHEIQTQESLTSDDCQFPGISEYIHRRKGMEWRYREELVKQDLIRKDKDNYKVSFATAFKLKKIWIDTYKKSMEERASLLNDTEFEPVKGLAEVESQAYLRQKELMRNARFDFRTKTIFFLISLIVFAVVIGSLFSWFVLLALFPVLIFHELGHLLAMRYFGYRNLQMLFIPLGAVVIGEPTESVTPWKEAIVILAGPVPGIILAFAAMMIWPEPESWVSVLIYTSLFLNYMNLLPIMPLDGGQLVHLTLFQRKLALRFALKSLSVLSFTLGAWLLSDPVLALLAVLFGFAYFTEARFWFSLRGFKDKFAEASDNISSVQRAFLVLSDQKMLFAEKSAIVAALVPDKPKIIPSFATTTSVLAIYAGLFIAPMIGAWAYFNHNGFDENYAYNEDMYSAEYWNTNIAAEVDPGEKIDLMISAYGWLHSDDDSVDAINFLDSAEDMALKEEDWPRYSEAVTLSIKNALYSDNTDNAVAQYWSLIDKEVADTEHLLQASRSISYKLSTDEAFLYLARSLGYASRDDDEYEVFEAYKDLAYNRIESNQIELADEFINAAYITDINDLDDYQIREISDLLVASGKLSEASKLLSDLLAEKSSDVFQLSAAEISEQLGWLALEADNTALARQYFDEADKHYAVGREEVLESVGLLGRLLLGSDGRHQFKATTQGQWLYRVVIAFYTDDSDTYHKAIEKLTEGERELRDIIESYETYDDDNVRGRAFQLRRKHIFKALSQRFSI